MDVEASASTATCRIVDSGGTDDNQVTIRTTGLTPQKTYDILIVAEFDGRKFFLDGFDFTTDANGVLVTHPIAAEDPDMEIAWVVYDDTSYRGEGTITACPQTVTLSPK